MGFLTQTKDPAAAAVDRGALHFALVRREFERRLDAARYHVGDITGVSNVEIEAIARQACEAMHLDKSHVDSAVLALLRGD